MFGPAIVLLNTRALLRRHGQHVCGARSRGRVTYQQELADLVLLVGHIRLDLAGRSAAVLRVRDMSTYVFPADGAAADFAEYVTDNVTTCAEGARLLLAQCEVLAAQAGSARCDDGKSACGRDSR